MRSLLLICLIALLVAGCGGDPQTFEELKSEGQKTYIRAEYKKARGYFIRALQLETRDRESLYLTGLCYERDYMYDSALFYLNRSNLLHPDDREINERIYEIAIRSNQTQYALDAIGVLIRIGDPVDKWIEVLATLHTAQGDVFTGYKYYRKLLETDRENPDFWLKLANAAAGTDSLEFALDILDTALEKFGRHQEYLASRGLILATVRRYTEAEEVYRELVSIDTTIYAYRMGLANVLSSKDDRASKEEALAICEQLQPLIGSEFRVDSIIAGLRRSLRQ